MNTVIGLDLDAALADDTMADYLTEAAGSTTAIMVNISLWITGGAHHGSGSDTSVSLGPTISSSLNRPVRVDSRSCVIGHVLSTDDGSCARSRRQA